MAPTESTAFFTADDGLERVAFLSRGDDREGALSPAVLMIHGLAGTTTPSGPPVMPKLIETLNAYGIGTARYLPRVYELFAEDPGLVDWHAELSDARGALGLLHGQDWVDPNEVYLFGLSLGGVAAPIVARSTGGVAGIASFGSTARSWAEYSVENIENQLQRLEHPASKIAKLSKLESLWQELLRDTDLGGEEIIERAPTLKVLGISAEGRYERSVTFWRQVARTQPAESYQGSSYRVLALRGSADACCHPADQEAIASAARAAGLKVDRVVITDLDHSLRFAAGPTESLRGEVSSEPHPEPLARALACWIKGEEQPGR